MKTVRIGAGAGFSGDRIDPAADLARRGDLDYLVFECLAERTIALAQLEKLNDPSRGFDRLLTARFTAVLPNCVRAGTRIITNMGAANPLRAGTEAVRVARALGLSLKIAVVTGDDVVDRVGGCVLDETGESVDSLGDRLVSAHAYIGVAGIVEALGAGADIVICGRTSDPALYLGPLVHEFGWKMDDWQRLGQGTLIGHMLECAAQVSGGYFADPGYKNVPDLTNIGFPLVEVSESGEAIIAKLEGTGGRIDRATCTEQLLYEIHNPSRYVQPDVVADFSNVDFEEIGPDRVAIRGAKGHPSSGQFKVSVGCRDGWIGVGEISYAGPGAKARGDLAAGIVKDRLKSVANSIDDIRFDLIGMNALLPQNDNQPEPREVRLRIAARCLTREVAEKVADEVEALYLCGPAGGGGVTRSVREVIGIRSAYLPASSVAVSVQILEA